MQTEKFQGVQSSVTIGNDGTVTGTYRGTAVAVRLPDCSVRLNSGGWKTYTTKARMNQFSAEFCGGRFTVYQKAGEWFVTVREGRETVTMAYLDGMVIAQRGN